MSEIIENNKTIIGSSTVIEGLAGTITCGGDVELKGQFNGTLKSEGNAYISGTLQGSIKANDILIVDGAKIDGTITSRATLTVEKGSKIAADLKAKNASIDALVNGNIEVNNQLDVLSSAEINGAVSAERLSVAAGALLEGNMVIKHK
ncbi:MAG: polymer-forming cytoskeletal protein [Erysipelotrichaceae bacterium]|nr:polymer-forming cytoskeletal protein [Erysipelotrichaceae bacterium]